MSRLYDSSRPDPVDTWSERIGVGILAVLVVALALACVVALVR